MLQQLKYYQASTLVSSGVGLIRSVTVDPRSGEQYLSGWNTYVITKVLTSGSISTFAGSSGVGGRADGTGTSASFSYDVWQISYCGFDGNIYIADTWNHVLRVTNTVSEVRTIAGGSTSGSTNGVGTYAKFNVPTGVACNSNNGDVVVSDWGRFVHRLDSWPTRAVTGFAGGLGTSGFADGMGTYARFSIYILHITQNSVNTHFYLADQANNVIRQVTLLGSVSTIAGRAGVAGNADGIGTLAYLNNPVGVSCDEISGNIIVGDGSNHRIRAIDVSSGLVTTIAGWGAGGTGTAAGSAINGIGTYTQVMHISLSCVDV